MPNKSADVEGVALNAWDISIGPSILRFYSMFRENTSIAFVVDRSLRVLLWSNGLVEATNLTQDTVEGREVSSRPFLSEEIRDNTTAAIRQLFLEKQRGAKRRMVMALVPGASNVTAGATREVLLHFTAAFFDDSQHVVCLGRELEGALSSLLQDDNQGASESMSSLTSATCSGMITDMGMIDSSFVQPAKSEADWRDWVAISTLANDNTGSTEADDGGGMVRCCNCGIPAQILQRCSGCRQRAYCNRSCQLAAWEEGHKHECELLRADAASRKNANAAEAERQQPCRLS